MRSVIAIVLLACLAMASAQKPGQPSQAFYEAKLNKNAVVGEVVKSSVKGLATVNIVNDTYAIGAFKFFTPISDAFMAHVHLANSTSNGPVGATAFFFLNNGAPQYITGKFQGAYTFDPSVGNITALLAAGDAYFNVHTKQYPAGEVRGQFKLKA